MKYLSIKLPGDSQIGGSQYEKVVDLASIVTLQNRHVTISPIDTKSKKHIEPRASFSTFNDEEGNTWGIPLKFDKGRLVFRRLSIDGSRMFNLNRKEEAMEFELWKRSPFVQGGIVSGHTRPLFFINDPEKQAQDMINREKLIAANRETLIGYSKEKIRELAIAIFGSGFATASNAVQLAKLLEYNQSSDPKQVDNPARLNKRLNDQRSVELVSIFEEARALGLITMVPNQGFTMENGAVLGVNIQGSMQSLASNFTLYNMLKIRVAEVRKGESVVKTQPIIPAKPETPAIENHDIVEALQKNRPEAEMGIMPVVKDESKSVEGLLLGEHGLDPEFDPFADSAGGVSEFAPQVVMDDETVTEMVNTGKKGRKKSE